MMAYGGQYVDIPGGKLAQIWSVNNWDVINVCNEYLMLGQYIYS